MKQINEVRHTKDAMGLYIAYSSDIHLRKVNTFFSLSDDGYELSAKSVKKDIGSPLFYKFKTQDDIVAYIKNNRIDVFEIEVSPIGFKDTLETFEKFLLLNDVSIGLITTDERFIDENEDVLAEYGVVKAILPLYASAGIDDKPEDKGIIKIKCVVRSSRKVRTTSSIKYSPSPVANIELEESFHDKFMKYLIESDMDNAEIYKKAGVSRQVFSKIISDKDMIPTKNTLAALAIGLELSLKEAKDLMESAGYALSKSIPFDAIISKYLKLRIYDLNIINSELNEYQCPLLGWQPREK